MKTINVVLLSIGYTKIKTRVPAPNICTRKCVKWWNIYKNAKNLFQEFHGDDIWTSVSWMSPQLEPVLCGRVVHSMFCWCTQILKKVEGLDAGSPNTLLFDLLHMFIFSAIRKCHVFILYIHVYIFCHFILVLVVSLVCTWVSLFYTLLALAVSSSAVTS